MVRILVADDDDGVLSVFRSALETKDYVVDTAFSGTGAIEHMDKHSYDAIISDIDMPGMDGIALLKAVRERDLDVPVILATGRPEVETAVRAIEYGAMRYLSKPVKVKSLLGESSSYFLLDAKVEVADRNLRLYSVLERKQRQVRAIARANSTRLRRP